MTGTLGAVIVDLNPLGWAQLARVQKQDDVFEKVLQHVLLYINAFLGLRYDNHLLVIAACPNQSHLLYPAEPQAAAEAASKPKPVNVYEEFHTANEQVASQLRAVFRQQQAQFRAAGGGDDDDAAATAARRAATSPTATAAEDAAHVAAHLGVAKTSATAATSAMASALSKALAYTNKVKVARPDMEIATRSLIISLTPDNPAEYVPLMNCIFAAQKMGHMLEVCKLHRGDTAFLEQAAHITGSNFIQVDDVSRLAQTLLQVFLPDQETRRWLVLPTKEDVDFRAACFCHKRIVSVGFVCSICLSIFCAPQKECIMCGTEYDISSLPASLES
ncbi:hypothetical protein CXG81DRAFT_24367 [Caulochytrium protostelioides]|uniref:General transcription and DNA repair factor IIH subunit TFB4 n=1 Tax=Caulochytrium protostelioides TaxID=1555241 RepID=A0A4P9XCT7_9FUNG|nr:hypothetical protein CXG81DRAFT_24367 [Caulochytrium protostelioides]|eukprot:RKP02961.1 hypothetical protein CXG81DRAFT_24367 [Caulochytrium protostelioides]